MPARVRKGDTVAVVSGNERGKRGRVLRVLPRESRLIVEGVNLRTRHLRKSARHPQGGRVRKEAPIHVSNVMPIDPQTSRPTRVSSQPNAQGLRERVARRSRQSLESGGGRSRRRAARAAGEAAGKEA